MGELGIEPKPDDYEAPALANELLPRMPLPAVWGSGRRGGDAQGGGGVPASSSSAPAIGSGDAAAAATIHSARHGS